MKNIKDGWHTISGYSVYVEDGKVMRGTLGTGFNYRPAWPFRVSRYGGWGNCAGLTVDAFRAGVRRGTIMMH